MLEPIDEFRRQTIQLVRTQVNFMTETIYRALDNLETTMFLLKTPNAVDARNVKTENASPMQIKVENSVPAKEPSGKHLIRFLTYFTFTRRSKQGVAF